MSPQQIIIGEVFFVLIVLSGYLFYIMLKMNKRLSGNNAFLQNKIAEIKSRIKGLKLQVKDLTRKVFSLEAELATNPESYKSLEEKFFKLEKENHQLLVSA